MIDVHATAAAPDRPATEDDLLAYDGKAEIIDGRIVPYMVTGYLHGHVALNIIQALWPLRSRPNHYLITDATGYRVTMPDGKLRTFSPDVSVFVGEIPKAHRRLVVGPPTFAVEVRSPEDGRPAGLKAMAEKRVAYIAAGTRAIWDVDPDSQTVRLHTTDAQTPTEVFAAGDVAHPADAIVDWTMTVAAVFDGTQ